MRAWGVLFPGVWAHELAHAAACVVSGVSIHEMHLGTTKGHVVHDASNMRGSILISTAPLVVGFILATLLLAYAKTEGGRDPIVCALLFWVGFSIAFHAIPSTRDMMNVFHTIPRRVGETWQHARPVWEKLAKTGVYAVAWPLVGIGVLLVMLVNSTVLFRFAWALGVVFWA